MATHSSVLVWRILGMGEPGGLPSMGSHRVGQDLAAAAAIWFIFLYTTPKYGSFSRLTEIQPSSLSFYSAPSTIY